MIYNDNVMYQKRDVVKVSWSGGKDSTAAAFLHLLRGDRVKAVCYIPMLTNEIPLIFPDHYDFIQNTAEKMRKMGAEVYIIHGITYIEHFKTMTTRGVNKGLYYGFPYFGAGKCFFQKTSKKKALDNIDVGYFDYEDIGIAIDEPARLKNIDNKYKRSILAEYDMTERDAYNYCCLHHILSPHYERGKRDGCALCPQAKKSIREEYFRQYPEAIKVVKDLQDYQMKYKPGKYPLRNNKMFINEDGSVN